LKPGIRDRRHWDSQGEQASLVPFGIEARRSSNRGSNAGRTKAPLPEATRLAAEALKPEEGALPWKTSTRLKDMEKKRMTRASEDGLNRVGFHREIKNSKTTKPRAATGTRSPKITKR